MHSIVTTFRGAVIKVEVANFCAAMDTLIDQDEGLFDIYDANACKYVPKCSPNNTDKIICGIFVN